MHKMYDESEVARRIDEIKIGEMSLAGAESESISMKETLFGERYSRASWIGVLVLAFA